MLKQLILALLISVPFLAQAANEPELIQVKYKGFEILVDCNIKSAIQWQYYPKRDTGNEKRHDKFYIDTNLPPHCSQTSNGTYRTKGQKTIYDRAHLVPANAMDSDPVSIAQSNFMTNVLPQHKNMNRGAWLETERYVECRRDNNHLKVIGGVYMGETPPYGDFTLSHGITAPQAFWKVVTYKNKVMAWWVPNSAEAKANRINDYIISVEEIESKAGVTIDIPLVLKDVQPTPVEIVPQGCPLS